MVLADCLNQCYALNRVADYMLINTVYIKCICDCVYSTAVLVQW